MQTQQQQMLQMQQTIQNQQQAAQEQAAVNAAREERGALIGRQSDEFLTKLVVGIISSEKTIRRNFVRVSDDFLTNTDEPHSDELPTTLRQHIPRTEFIGNTIFRRIGSSEYTDKSQSSEYSDKQVRQNIPTTQIRQYILTTCTRRYIPTTMIRQYIATNLFVGIF
ncbi:hypothetical protein DY000_02006837 [Brassica cretica]|uniref:Uncharacterized protein n=1 Tax=Brassica cretica TaxID=69181 RepID=A0ABQ7BXQ2_BRACR|nr:hypothetical protein DY000_02006837 [Brassica cretica]